MPALKPTQYEAEIVWLGRVVNSVENLRAEALNEVMAGFGGMPDDCHGGETRASCVRVASQYPEGTTIANTRQFSILSAEELDVIATEMGVEDFDPEWIGASIVLRGIPDFTYVPPASRLQSTSGATLVVDMENRPCVFPGRVINQDRPGMGKLFKPAAENRRGVTGWVEREGMLRVGDKMRLHIPDQRAWSQLAEARAS